MVVQTSRFFVGVGCGLLVGIFRVQNKGSYYGYFIENQEPSTILFCLGDWSRMSRWWQNENRHQDTMSQFPVTVSHDLKTFERLPGKLLHSLNSLQALVIFFKTRKEWGVIYQSDVNGQFCNTANLLPCLLLLTASTSHKEFSKSSIPQTNPVPNPYSTRW